MCHVGLDVADSRRGGIFSGFIVVIKEIGGTIKTVLVCCSREHKSVEGNAQDILRARHDVVICIFMLREG